MAIQYYMRGWTGSAYVDWVVNDQPDNAGTYAPVGGLTNIVVNRVVQSKVDNFIKPSEGLNSPAVGADGYWIHVNAYDWINATPPGPPIPVPQQITGLAVVRGSVSGSTPNDYSTLFWDENSQTWTLAFNTNGDGTTVGAYQNLKLGAMTMAGPLSVGLPAATTGLIRISNNQSDSSGNTGAIKSRSSDDTTDITLILADASNHVQVGSATDGVYMPANLRVDGYITHGSNSLASTTGFLRNPNNSTIITAKSVASSDVVVLQTDSSDRIVFGGLTSPLNTGVLFNTAVGGQHIFMINSAAQVRIGSGFIDFDSAVSNPILTQLATTIGNGQALTIAAQSSTASPTSTGGNLILSSGTGVTANGIVNIQSGGTTELSVAATSVTQFNSLYNFDVGVTAPTIQQSPLNVVSGTGQALTIQAQNNIAASSTGGALVLSSGSGSTTSGRVIVETGGLAQIVVSPTNLAPLSFPVTTGKVIITGNLEVQGTTTTVDSTVVDIIGRVIHGNWSDPSVNPNAGVPTQIAGYSIHRGNASGVPRDGAAWIWTEGALTTGADGYWRAVTTPGDGYGTDGYTIANSPNILHVMASDFSASATPNPGLGVLASVGGLRTQNNTTAVASRTAALSSDLLLLGTDSTNHVIHGDSVNAGQIFNISTGSLYNFEVNGVSTYTITPVSSGATTLQAVSTVTSLTYKQADLTTNSGVGATTTLQAQNETGTTSTGGALVLTSGTGTTTAGNTQLQTGGVDRLIVHPSFTEFRDTAEALRITPVSAGTTQITYAATVTAAQINQTQTASTPAAPMTHQAQVTTAASGVGGTLSLIAGNATGTTSTGGALNLASGSGTTSNGVINFQPGGTTQVLITATGAQIQWVTGVSAPTLKQNDNTTNGATAQALTIQAQNATGTTSTGGAAVITSGTGTTVAGNVNLQTGAVTKVSVNPTFTTFNDTTEAFRITPVSSGATVLQAVNTATSVTYKQADLTTASGVGAATTIQAQNETGTTSTGGALNLTSGTGTTANGNVNLQVGGTTTASLVPNKFVLNKGWRRNVTAVTTTYQVLTTDEFISITSIASAFTITMPLTPTTGDTYTIKDSGGNAATNHVTISGNGVNIDGTSTISLSQNYAAVVLTYTGSQWSVS